MNVKCVAEAVVRGVVGPVAGVARIAAGVPDAWRGPAAAGALGEEVGRPKCGAEGTDVMALFRRGSNED